MSEIRDKARSYLNHGAEINRHKLIRDLLAELERVEGNRESECMECEKLACIEIRQKAAMECVEIIVKETKPHPLFQGGFCNLVLSAIKRHFNLESPCK